MGNGNGNNNTEVIVAVVALIVSIVALSATFMQVLQQYYASAAGYSQCNSKVMGEWAKTKARRFVWEELRFEVQFDAPVIFVSPPGNDRGPVPGAPIFYLEGTDKSLRESWTTPLMDLRREYEKRSPKERIHTADNERASWSILLSAIQQMEGDSSAWQLKEYKDLGPDLHRRCGLPNQPPSLTDSHTLTMAVQRKRKSWDTMPTAITKPYATTTMCHLVEMMASLGIYWKEFDRKRDRYRGEGNGFMVYGESISDLGLMFSFQVYGACEFGRNRVIPVDEVKALCFGYVPTIYGGPRDLRGLVSPHEGSQSIGTLQMGSVAEIAETLVLIGCNNNTVRYFRDEGMRTSHLFPMAFEILGMLSRTFHIRGSGFSYVPNPTPDRWDKRSVSLIKVLQSFQELFGNSLFNRAAPRNPSVIRRINNHINKIVAFQANSEAEDRLLFLNALHDALNDADQILTARNGPAGTAESEIQIRRREAVQDVLRSHIQEVMRLLNDREDRSSDSQSLYVPDPPSPGTSRFPNQPRPPAPRFDDMNAASPDERQHAFMEVYFEVIRPRVVPHAINSTDRRASMSVAPFGHPLPLRRRDSDKSNVSSASMPSRLLGGRDARNASPMRLSIELSPDAVAKSDEDSSETPKESGAKSEKVEEKEIALADIEVSHDDIWCTLVFRMICWLMLHDFNKLDVQLPKSELMGSRMPVYIA